MNESAGSTILLGIVPLFSANHSRSLFRFSWRRK